MLKNIIKRAASMEVEICGLKFGNPVMPAAGPPVMDAEFMMDCIEGGCGGIVAKTISVEAAKVPRPCMIKVGSSNTMLNHELWSDKPWEDWLNKEYPKFMEEYPDIPFIGSAGYTKEEIAYLAPFMLEAGADILELSIHYLGSDPTMMQDSIKAAIEATEGKVPIFPKLSPNIPDIQDFAIKAQEAGASGIVAINSVGPCLGIDIETAMPVTGGANGYGWMSGEAIKPMALRCVFEISSVVDIPVIGVGGISTGEDAIEFMMAGASAVGVCTAAIYKGPKVYGKIVKQMNKWLDEHDYESVNDIVGLAIENNQLRTPPYLDVKVPTVDEDLCTQCGACATQCIYEAITIERGECPEFNAEKCYGCGLCRTFCKFGALQQFYWE